MSSQRPSTLGRKPSMRPPISTRPSNARAFLIAPTQNGRISPTESTTSTSTNSLQTRSPSHKRKERDFEQDGGEETNIHVVVRCRGRNEREVRENSGVVVSTDGVKGKTVELSMGPSALSNKTYHFDKVFSPAADQNMVFDEVVVPILDEVLSGFNCTIFAYGQTGTGKTYTMSGDITHALPLPDACGIIPRVLHSLFEKLEGDDGENSVKCSFIELYNEELRDLLSPDDSIKLKIYEETAKKGSNATLVQGMEEAHIKSAAKGIDMVRVGSLKRQVAATKCNDLSSRSHTVFTITVYMKRTSDTGEEYVSAGKLNLVDLAGSENIQRSGAENKRAAEAGLINKSLLTLGRVINALVDKSSHIPYRESKLTRLLQDSLGGRTKTCIIATLSPAKSNLEETISTLDYAFRAKNIRNKPQINQLVSKKTLLKDFTAEIEKLKGELISARQRNGVFLTPETYEELTTESESRRILSEEQKDKIDTLEVNLRNKAQELYSLTSSFSLIKKDNEAVRLALIGNRSVLEKTEIVLAHTRDDLEKETELRRAHQATEEELASIGYNLISTLGMTTNDIDGLHSKIRRQVTLQGLHQTEWAASQGQVVGSTNTVEERINAFEARQTDLVGQFSMTLKSYVADQTETWSASQVQLERGTAALATSKSEVNSQTTRAHEEMNEVLAEIEDLRNNVKKDVGQGLNGLSAAAECISAGIIEKLDNFNTQLHSSFVTLGKDLRVTFDDLVKQLDTQQVEAERLRHELSGAFTQLIKANETARLQLNKELAEEKERGVEDRNKILVEMTAYMTTLMRNTGTAQEARLDNRIGLVEKNMIEATASCLQVQEDYEQSMDTWMKSERNLLAGVMRSREGIKSKIKTDWTNASAYNESIQATTRSVHQETVDIVNTQMKHMDKQLQALDEVVVRIRAQNGRDHDTHVESLNALTMRVQNTYSTFAGLQSRTSERTRLLQSEVDSKVKTLGAEISSANQDVIVTLANLRANAQASTITEYVATGQTPQKTQYQYCSTLPRTNGLDKKPAMYNSSIDQDVEELNSTEPKATVYEDIVISEPTSRPSSPVVPRLPAKTCQQGSLRELDVNIVTMSKSLDSQDVIPRSNNADTSNQSKMQPPVKRQNTGIPVFDAGSTAGLRKTVKRLHAEGRENVAPIRSTRSSRSRAS